MSNPKLKQMIGDGSYREILTTEENDLAKDLKLLQEDMKRSNSNYIHEDKIKEITGKTVQDLGLEDELDDDSEIGLPGVKNLYSKNVKHTTKIEDFFNNEATEQDYHDVITNEFDHDWTYGYGGVVRDALKNSKFNTPKTNNMVLGGLGVGLENNRDVKDESEHFIEHFNMGWDNMEHILSDSTMSEFSSSLLANDEFKEEHAHKVAEMFPKIAAHEMAHNDTFAPTKERFLDKESNWDLIPSHHLYKLIDSNIRDQHPEGRLNRDSSDRVSEKFANQIIKYKPSALQNTDTDVILGSLDEHDRNKFIDGALGITGGSHDHTLPNESEDFDADNWDNWNDGDDHSLDDRLLRVIAGSRHLNDGQIEHIKRHGTFDSKYALYHNENIDSRHGIEMYNKWAENHDTHGYDSGEITEVFRDDKGDVLGFSDLPEDVQDDLTQSDEYYEYIDQTADGQYTMDDYVYDNKESIVNKMGDKFDDADEIYDKIHEEGHDWVGKNTNSTQNIGNPQFDALDKLHTESDGDLENHSFTVGDLKADHNIDIEDYGITPDEYGNVDGEELSDKLNEFGGPSQIDYGNHDDFAIHDHPEFDERYESAAQEHRSELLDGDRRREITDDMYLYDDYRESNGYIEAQEEASNDWKEDSDNFRYELDNLYDNSHIDDRFIPEHIVRDMPEMEEIRTKRRIANRSVNIDALENIKHNQLYGEGQHLHELALDHAEANNGSIDIGTLHKKFPNLKDRWKKMFAGKGKLSSGDIRQKIEDIPKTNYDITYGDWKKGKMQNINERDQIVVRLDHSDDSLKEIYDHEDPNVKEMFDKVQKISKQSGHPTNDRSVAWARVDISDPEHFFIDEVQSDFGKTVTKYLKEHGEGDKANAINEISRIHKDWRENLINHVIKTAKDHGVKKVSTHSPESKHSHAGHAGGKIHSVYKDSYKKVPKQMGFVESAHDTLPLTDSGTKHFKAQTADKLASDTTDHSNAFDHHMEMADTFNHMATNHYDPKDKHLIEESLDFANQHKSMADKHHAKLKTANLNRGWTPKTVFDNNDLESANTSIQDATKIESHDADQHVNKPMGKPPQDVEFKGHTLDLTPESMKKSIEMIIDLIKKEYEFVKLLKSGEVNKELLIDIQEIREKL